MSNTPSYSTLHNEPGSKIRRSSIGKFDFLVTRAWRQISGTKFTCYLTSNVSIETSHKCAKHNYKRLLILFKKDIDVFPYIIFIQLSKTREKYTHTVTY